MGSGRAPGGFWNAKEEAKNYKKKERKRERKKEREKERKKERKKEKNGGPYSVPGNAIKAQKIKFNKERREERKSPHVGPERVPDQPEGPKFVTNIIFQMITYFSEAFVQI
jgi:FtsZ-interacting cell division protein ZipA